jgi:hypothetical protein
VCDRSDQAAHYHNLGPQLGASLLTRHIGWKQKIESKKKNVDMHFMCVFCDGNSLTALKEYQHQYPLCNLRETGILIMHALADRGRHNVRDQEDVLNEYCTQLPIN